MSDALLSVEDLRVEFPLVRGSLNAVDGATFEVRQGEAFGLVGESGSGKTMTLRALVGLLPRTATLVSGDKTGAYKYLPESVNTFIGREQMMAMMRDAGFQQVEQFPMTFGVCVCYRGLKP